MKDRIRRVMEELKMTQKEFAQFTGISEGSLSGVFNDRTRPTLQMVEAIHDKLPSISVEWLMFGTGDMSELGHSLGIGSNDESQISNTDVDHMMGGFTDYGQTSICESLSRNERSNHRDIEKTIVKYIDKPQRRITEIRIFFDDQTWETFVSKD